MPVTTCKIGIFGCGTVGLEVSRILLDWEHRDAAIDGVRPVLTAVCARDWSKPGRADIPAELRVSTWRELLDRGADILVELAGGMGEAHEFIRAAIERGIPVVTANKLLLAHHGQTLLAAAEAKELPLEFEAAVGGGIPIIQALREGLAANAVNGIAGILNGTSNYILTRMAEDKLSYFNALKIAQDKGFAEKDPQADVAGEDAAQKLTLLSRIAFGAWVPWESVTRSGIENVTTEELLLSQVLGYHMKPLVVARREGAGLSMYTGPTLVDESSLLSNVRMSDNAVTYDTELAGDVTITGKGAGGRPTASAVLSDILRVACDAQAIGYRPETRMPLQPPGWQTRFFLCWTLKSIADQVRVLEDMKAAGLHIVKSTVRGHGSHHFLGAVVTGDCDRAELRARAERRGLAEPKIYPVL